MKQKLDTSNSRRSRVSIRFTRMYDLDFVAGAEGDPGNAGFIVGWSYERHCEALGDEAVRHFVFEAGDGERVGFGILYVDDSARSVEFRRLVVTEKGRGYGRSALRLVEDLAFRELGAHRLWLDVKENNERARALYESEGFVEEGVLRECLKRGDGYESLVVMSKLESEYEHGH